MDRRSGIRGQHGVKIAVPEDSPNRRGSSNLLAGEFICGVQVYAGCVRCDCERARARKSDMEVFRRQIFSADILVFVMPLYYCGMSTQRKVLMNCFCAINGSIARRHMKSTLIAAGLDVRRAYRPLQNADAL